jgi:hypothetical protein
LGIEEMEEKHEVNSEIIRELSELPAEKRQTEGLLVRSKNELSPVITGITINFIRNKKGSTMKDVREMSADEQQEIINEAVHAGNMAYADVLQIIANKDVGKMSADELREVINEAVHASNMAYANAVQKKLSAVLDQKNG